MEDSLITIVANDDLPFPPSSSPSSSSSSSNSRRPICEEGCGRPLKSCLCSHLPSTPLPTRTTVVVLQHPHELRHKLSTSPLLPRCLLSCHLLSGRRLRHGSHPLLDCLSLLPASAIHDTLFLFPTPVDSSLPPPLHLRDLGDRSRPALLVVFDGTWAHAREMAAASLPFLRGFATQVTLGVEEGEEGEGKYGSELVLRKEPWKGCVSTMEAVARALRVLEPEGSGEDVEEKLLGVLRAMVKTQARHLKPMKPRVRAKKKKKGVEVSVN